MTKNDLANIIYKNPSLTKDDCRDVVDRLFRAIRLELETKGKVRLNLIGEFRIKARKARRCYNPSTGEMDILPATQLIKFFPSGSLKASAKHAPVAV